MKKAVNVKVTVCFYHVTYTFRVNLHSDQAEACNFIKKETLAQVLFCEI